MYQWGRYGIEGRPPLRSWRREREELHKVRQSNLYRRNFVLYVYLAGILFVKVRKYHSDVGYFFLRVRWRSLYIRVGTVLVNTVG